MALSTFSSNDNGRFGNNPEFTAYRNTSIADYDVKKRLEFQRVNKLNGWQAIELSSCSSPVFMFLKLLYTAID